MNMSQRFALTLCTLFFLLQGNSLNAQHSDVPGQLADSCQLFPRVLEAFENSYQENQIGDLVSNAALLHQLNSKCSELPENDRFWEVVYLQVRGDTNYFEVNEKSLEFNQARGDSFAMMRNLIVKGAGLFTFGKGQEAATALAPVLKWARHHAHFDLFEKAAINLSKAWMMLNEWGNALETMQNGIRFMRTAPDSLPRKEGRLGNFQLMAGYISRQIGHKEDAYSFTRQAIDNMNAPADRQNLASAMNQLGSFQMEDGREDSALASLETALSLTDTSNYQGKLNYSRIAYSLANLMRQQKNWNNAEAYARLSVKFDEQFSEGENLEESRLLLGEILTETRPAEAIPVLEKSRDYFLGIKNFRFASLAARQLGRAYAQLAQPDSAAKNWQLAISLTDSLYSGDLARGIEEARVRFRTEQKELQLAETEKLAETRQQLIWAVVIGLGITLVLAILLLLAFARMKRANNILKIQQRKIIKQNEEKELLLREIHHRVKNNLQIVSNLLELQARGIDDETALARTREGQNRVRSMALIHQLLYQNDDLRIDFQGYLEKLIAEIETIYKPEFPVKKVIDAGRCEFDIDTAIPLGLIVTEMVTNAFKYGFREQKSPELSIKVEAKGGGQYELHFADNGPGLPPGLDWKKSRSLGLRLINRLTRQLQGKLDTTSENGAHFQIVFKDTAARRADAE